MPLRSSQSGGGVSGLTANTAVYANTTSSIASATPTVSELNFVSGVTSAVQTQLDAKQLSANRFATALTFTQNATTNVSSTTLTQPSGMIAQNVSIPLTGSYLVSLQAEVYQGGTGDKVQFGVDVDTDGGTAFPLIWNMGSDLDRKVVTSLGVFSLTAGTRAVKPMFKRVSGSNNVSTDTSDSAWIMTISSI